MKLACPASAFGVCFAIRPRRELAYLLAVLALLAGAQQVAAQGTAFTYQGGLENNGVPANGNYDFAFALYNDMQSGSQVAGTETNIAVTVSNGLFTTSIDFTSEPWNGGALWLQVLVRTNGSGAFSSLRPRQAVTSVPYAIQSLNAATAAAAGTATTAISANSVAAANLTGTVLNSALPANPVFQAKSAPTRFRGTVGG